MVQCRHQMPLVVGQPAANQATTGKHSNTNGSYTACMSDHNKTRSCACFRTTQKMPGTHLLYSCSPRRARTKPIMAKRELMTSGAAPLKRMASATPTSVPSTRVSGLAAGLFRKSSASDWEGAKFCEPCNSKCTLVNGVDHHERVLRCAGCKMAQLTNAKQKCNDRIQPSNQSLTGCHTRDYTTYGPHMLMHKQAWGPQCNHW